MYVYNIDYLTMGCVLQTLKKYPRVHVSRKRLGYRNEKKKKKTDNKLALQTNLLLP